MFRFRNDAGSFTPRSWKSHAEPQAELAAARVKVLPVPRLAERNERFKLLTGGGRDALPRQQTLHALLDWSYDLLTEQEPTSMPLRAYALEKLRTSREHDVLARRHAAYFRVQAEAAHERRGSSSTLTWFASVELELDKYRSPLTWALTQGSDAVVGGAIACSLTGLWANAGLAVEGR